MILSMKLYLRRWRMAHKKLLSFIIGINDHFSRSGQVDSTGKLINKSAPVNILFDAFEYFLDYLNN